MFASAAREKVGSQIQAAAEKIASNVAGVGVVALLALAVACGALFISMRALKAARA